MYVGLAGCLRGSDEGKFIDSAGMVANILLENLAVRVSSNTMKRLIVQHCILFRTCCMKPNFTVSTDDSSVCPCDWP